MKYLTKENITLAIALFGAIGTIFTWILNAIHNHKNLDLKIVQISRTEKQLTMYLSILNKSQLPISISGIAILLNNVYYPCDVISHSAYTIHYSNKDTDICTLPFPITLGSLSGTSGYIEFDISSNASKFFSNPLTVQVSTNRGKAIEMKLNFEDLVDWDDM